MLAPLDSSSRSEFGRRDFLFATGGGVTAGMGLAAQSAAAPRPDASSKTKLGLDLFSLRSQGWDAFQMLDFAAKHGVDSVHFSEPRFLGSLEQAHLRKVKDHADQLGLEIEVGFGSICPTSTRFDEKEGTAPEQLLKMFQVAKTLGSPFVRCYLGSSRDRAGDIPFEQHIDNTIASCKAVRGQALDMGIKIAIENHAGDMQAFQLKGLIEEAGPDYVGALVDAGNATWTLEDPLHTLETLAPHALASGVRDSAIWLSEGSAEVMWVPMGDGNIDIRGWAKRFVELCPGKTFSLEIINVRGPRPFPYLDPEFWEAYRDVPAWVFSGFLKLAGEGTPYTKVPPGPEGVKPDSPEFREFLVEQERRDVERDIAFTRQLLDKVSA